MSKSKDFKLDPYGFDDSLDMPDFNVSTGKIKDDRSPAVNLAKGVMGGVKDAATDGGFIRNMLKKSLPDGYGKAIDLADQSVGTLKSVYDDAAKEIKPVVNDLKRTTGKILPTVESKLPKDVAARIKKWADSADKAKLAEMSPEEQRAVALQMQLGEIFKYQAMAANKKDSEDKAHDTMQAGIDLSRHRDSMGQMDAMRISLQQMASYQSKIESSYQRKSLELQFRSYFLAQDALEEAKKFNATAVTNLEGILKNTGLPDFVKLKGKESIEQIIRNRFINGLSDSVFDNRSKFIANLGGNLRKALKDKISDKVSSIRMGLDAADTMHDSANMMAGFDGEGGPSKHEMYGNMAGVMGANAAGNWISGKLRKYVPKGGKIDRFGSKLNYTTSNISQIMTNWSRNRDNVDDKSLMSLFGRGGPLSFLGDIAEDAISASNRTDKSLITDRVGNMQDPAHFSRGVSKSISEVIPGYLARIYRELQIMRTGDSSVELTHFDFNSDKFTDKAKLKKAIFEDVTGMTINDNSKAIKELKSKKNLSVAEKERLAQLEKTHGKSDNTYTKDEVNNLIKEIDPNNTLTSEQRSVLGKYLLNDNLNNGLGSAARLTNESTFTGEASKHSDTFANLFKDYFKGDDVFKQESFQGKFSKLGSGIRDQRKYIQDYLNTGNREILEELGLIKGDQIDTKKLNEYFYGDTYHDTKQGDSRVNKFTSNAPANHSFAFGSPGNTATIEHQVAAVQKDNSDIVDAINTNSTRTISNTISETLIRIEEKIMKGFTFVGTGGGSDGGSAAKKPWWDRSIKDTASGLWGAGIWGVKKAGSFGKEMLDRTTSILGSGLSFVGKIGGNIAGKGFEHIADRIKKVRDVYVDGELTPRIVVWKLKAGEYRDQATGKVIKSYKDISGAVVDSVGNVVLTAEEAKRAYIKDGLVTKAISALGTVVKKTRDFGDALIGHLPAVYQFGIKTLRKGYGLLKLPQDVYTKDRPDRPTLLAKTMRSGGYRSRITGKVITNTDEIDGPVLDHQGNEVLTAEEFAKGLVDYRGKPLRTGLARLAGAGLDAFNFVKNHVGKGLRAAGNAAMGLLHGFGGILANGVHIGGFKSFNLILKRLTQIRDVTNDALPDDKRHRFDDGEDKSTLNALGKASGFFSGIKNSFKSKWGGGKKSDPVLNTEKSILETLRDRLPKRDKVFGDSDGDGIRDGSYADYMKKKKEAAAEKLKEMTEGAKGKGGSLLAGLAGLFGKKKDKDKEGEGEDKENLLQDAGNIASIAEAGWGFLKGGAKGIAKAGRWGLGKLGIGGKAAAGAAGLTGAAEAATAATGAGAAAGGLGAAEVAGGGIAAGAAKAGLLKGAAKFVGGRLIPGVGTAYGAYSTYDDLKQGNYGMAAIDAGLTLGSLALGGGAAIAGLFGSIPIGIAAATAAVGYGAYKGYKYLTRKKLDSLSKVRYAQYGFLPTDEDHLQAVFGLEDKVKDVITFNGDIADLNTDKLKVKDVVADFGIDPSNKAQLTNWLLWFNKRFKPVFLTNVSAINMVAKGKSLSDLDGLEAGDKKKFLDMAKWLSGPYDISVSPFTNLKSLLAGKKEVADLVDMANTEIQKDVKPGDKAATTTATGVAAATAGAAAVATTDKGKLQETNKQATSPSLGISGTAAVISMAGVPIGLNNFSDGRLDALTTIRYKTYGLKTLELEKVKALSNLETIINKTLVVSKGTTATWSGNPTDVLQAVGSSFGVEGLVNEEANNWISWFNFRFLPTYLNYLSSIISATKKQDPVSAKESLKSQQTVDAAMSVYTTVSNYNGSKCSVWLVPYTPWPGYELNSDAKSIDANMQGLKELAKQTVLSEQTSKTTTGLNNDASGPTSIFKSITNKLSSIGQGIAQGAATGGKWGGLAGAVAGGVMGGVKSIMGGREAQAPTGGTGGAINDIPQPQGDGSWNALKNTIMAAARMVGVDERLMGVMAAIESGFRTSVKAGTSSATGLYQFISGTWNKMVSKYGPKYGIAPGTSPTDARASALMGAEYIKENSEALKSVLNRPITDTDIYLAHFLGAGGAKKLLTADPNAIAANLMPDAARANHDIFYDKTDRPRTVAEVYAVVNDRVKSKGKQFGIYDGSESISTANTTSTNNGPTAKAAIAASIAANVGKTNNPIGGFNIADQTPGVPSTPSTSVVASTSAIPTPSDVSSPAIAAASAGFMSPKARDIAVQSQYRKDSGVDGLGNVADTLTASLKVQQDHLSTGRSQLEVLSKILNLMSVSATNKAGADKSSNVSSPSQSKVEKLPTPPVSMAKTPY